MTATQAAVDRAADAPGGPDGLERPDPVGGLCLAVGALVAVFRGAELDRLPPVEFKDPNERALHIHQDDDLDEQQLTSWFEQAAAILGWTP